MFLCSSFVSTLAVASTPPEPSLRNFPAAWLGFGLMFMFFVVVVLISVMSSKRGHQD
ncbi:MAG: hypothetical protein HOI88_00935 [Phycisphaerae bacterium]|nr:hypothetical protein [Phycisphaerae bacterium]MBT5366255.1 hypothetical protein [Phycisphaerae bacterium]MBT6268900.1 hypothetical protein [Phycisphaerae bacterium]MBT6281958.1 hypothetical protein [Phycisphaerae bacterium]MBT7658229.1 hypothetical protein [Phycisphaerae bacterium]